MAGKDEMTWLEMISVRTSGLAQAAKVFQLCRESLKSIAVEELLKVTVYSNAKYSTDISIHLKWKSDPGPESLLGIGLSSALGGFGLISHTIWLEQENFGAGMTVAAGSNKRSMG